MRARFRQSWDPSQQSAGLPAAAPQARRLVGEVGLEPTKASASGFTVRPLCRSGHSPDLEPRIRRMRVPAGLWGARRVVSTTPRRPGAEIAGRRDWLDIVLAARDCRAGNPPCATAARV